jgi:hypothetical protein
MRTTDLQELMNAVELKRAELHPELDAGFLESVVRAEEENPEDDDEAMRLIQIALSTVTAKMGAG